MARYLFAWELGGDYGHLARLLPLALELRTRGHDVVFAVRDLSGAERLVTPHGFDVLQAPLWLRRPAQLPPAIAYPELLLRFGFLHGGPLIGVCRAWRHLVTLLAPDAIVFDHAPTALLATRGLAPRRVVFGDGFCIPPPTQPMPPFRWWERENRARLQESERLVLGNANLVLAELGAPTLSRLAELHACDDTLMASFAELDHYPERDATVPYLGPVFALGQGVMPPWPGGDGPRVFAYLKSDYAALDGVLAALLKSRAPVLVHVPGAAPQTVQRFSGPTMFVSPDPLDIGHVRSRCDLAVCHGGAGTTAALLLAGKPLVVLPMQVEQAMAARRLAQTGAALVLEAGAAAQLPRLLKRMTAEPQFAAGAQDFARRHRDYDQMATVAAAATRCERVLDTPRRADQSLR